MPTPYHMATTPEVSNRPKGECGTPLTITVNRPYNGPDSILKFDLRAQQDTAPSVPYYGWWATTPGYILPHALYRQIGGRRAQCTARALKKESGHEVALFSTYAANPGGLLESAVKIMNYSSRRIPR